MRFTSLAAALAILGACNKSTSPLKKETEPAAESGRSAAGAEKSVLTLSKVEADETSLKTFDFTLSSEVFPASSDQLVLVHADGRSISYSHKTKAWSSVTTAHLTDGTESHYDFRDDGLFSLVGEVLSLRNRKSDLITAEKPAELGSTLNGVHPGFAASIQGNEANILMATGSEAKQLKLSNLPAGLQYIYPCNSSCALYGYDGKSILIYQTEGNGWSPLSDFNLPPAESFQRIGLYFKTDRKIIVENAVALAADGSIYLGSLSSAADLALTWDKDIRVIADRFCVSCHGDDGFENEETWKQLKSSIKARIDGSMDAKFSMPPPETKLGQEMSRGDKDMILKWLLEQEEGAAQGEIGGAGGNPVEAVAISGKLKEIAEPRCTPCHTDGRTEEFWKSRKEDIKARVNAGNMPLGSSLNAADKKALLDALEALEAL